MNRWPWMTMAMMMMMTGRRKRGGGLQKLAKEEGNTHNDMKHDKVDL